MVESENTTKDYTHGDKIIVTPDSGVVKRILTPGEQGDMPQKGQDVIVNYEGRLEDGTIFDTSADKEPLKFHIGEGQVIKGWDAGIMSMMVGEKAELTIAPEYAYGIAGNPPKIGTNATLIFDVELL